MGGVHLLEQQHFGGHQGINQSYTQTTFVTFMCRFNKGTATASIVVELNLCPDCFDQKACLSDSPARPTLSVHVFYLVHDSKIKA